jgi:taurine dioxygenase
MRISPLTPTIGAVVDGVDLHSLSDEVLHTVEMALADHLVLYFTGQSFDRFSLRELAQRFGPSFIHPIEQTQYADCPGVLEVKREPNKKNTIFGGGSWHADFTWNKVPGYVSLLHAKVLPAIGGDTCFVSSIAAFEALSPKMQAILRDLRAVHVYHDYSGEVDAQFNATHPVVRKHPITGKEGLFVNTMFVTQFEGMTAAESQALLEYLFKLLEDHRFSCRFRWSEGGLLLWDNRFTVHYPIHDNHDELRMMIWTSVLER